MATRQLTTRQVVNLSTDPASGTAGEIYYNTVSNNFKYYNGSAWVAISSGGGDSLPNQTGNAGNYLTTNGTTASWASITEDVQDIVGGMVSGNTESGISVTYDDTNGKLDFDVNDPTISLTGDVTGSATMSNLGNVSISTTIAPNSVELGVDTFGQYVAAISGTPNQIVVTGTGTEDIAATLSLPTSMVVPGTLTLNADPTQALHAVTKQYADAIAEGLHVHASVAAATTANIPNLSSAPAIIDQVTLTNGMRILVKNQTNNAQNGIYVYNSSTNALTRATDFDSVTEIQGGDFVFVTGGNLNDNTGWVQTETVETVGTSPIVFQQFSGAGTYTAGTGLALNGNQFSNTGVLSVNGSTGTVSGLAPTASPTFTGSVTVPTPVNSTDAATKGYVDSLSGSAMPIETGTSFPLSPQDGDLFFHQEFMTLNVYLGGAWIETGSVASADSGYASTSTFTGSMDNGFASTVQFSFILDGGNVFDAELLA